MKNVSNLAVIAVIVLTGIIIFSFIKLRIIEAIMITIASIILFTPFIQGGTTDVKNKKNKLTIYEKK